MMAGCGTTGHAQEASQIAVNPDASRIPSPDTSQPRDLLAHEFAMPGLIADMNSEEFFGAIQARLGAYASLPVGEAHAQLSLQNAVLPAHVTLPLSGNGRWFIKLGAAQIWASAADKGTRLVDSESTTALAQIQFRPRAGTLLGLGAIYESNAIHFDQGGRLSLIGAGVRFDLLQRLGDHAGLAVKASWLDGRTAVSIPLPGNVRITDHASSPRLYLQAGLIGNFSSRDMPWIPQGWSLRPALHVFAQRTTTAASVNNLGFMVPRDVQDYAELAITLRLQRETRGSGHPAPFAEIGEEQRLRARVEGRPTDPALAYAKAGVTMRKGGWGFFDAYLAYHDSLNGQMRAVVGEVLASLTF
jgi:hypothetical protein